MILSEKTLKNAGFTDYTPRKFTRLIVSSHPDVPGWIFKIYLDNQRYYKGKTEWEHWYQRIRGAEKIRQFITSHNLGHLFKVPVKKVYKLPSKPAPPKELIAKRYVLVEPDMELHSDAENLRLWKSSKVTHEMLDALHLMLVTLGLKDCKTPSNLPFAKDGRIAFIDTQSHGQKVKLSDLTEFLSRENRTYWEKKIGTKS